MPRLQRHRRRAQQRDLTPHHRGSTRGDHTYTRHTPSAVRCSTVGCTRRSASSISVPLVPSSPPRHSNADVVFSSTRTPRAHFPAPRRAPGRDQCASQSTRQDARRARCPRRCACLSVSADASPPDASWNGCGGDRFLLHRSSSRAEERRRAPRRASPPSRRRARSQAHLHRHGHWRGASIEQRRRAGV